MVPSIAFTQPFVSLQRNLGLVLISESFARVDNDVNFR